MMETKTPTMDVIKTARYSLAGSVQIMVPILFQFAQENVEMVI